jgi:glycosyltransferase involved in cell wall biosynthesis
MKVLLLNTYEQKGGAARAVFRLFEGLLMAGTDARLMVQEKQTAHPSVLKLNSPGGAIFNPLRPYIDFAIPVWQTRKRILFSTALLPDNLLRIVDELQPDLIHLHWITGGFIRLESLASLPCPVVWTLHDMWAFTGGCHNATDCVRYKTGCGLCPLLHSTRENDLSRKTFNRKRKVYDAIKSLTITTPSQWLAGQVRESSLLAGRPVYIIGNGLDSNVFKPTGRMEARKRLDLPQDKKIVLFGAIRATETPLKGFRILTEALKILDRKDILLVVFGSSDPSGADISGLEVRFKGAVHDDAVLADLYSTADVVAVPSRQEVFGQAASEALACGTPVVAFGVTGLLDIVDHQATGYLADPFKPESMAEGIRWILENPSRHKALCTAARLSAEQRFSITTITIRFLECYHKVSDGKSM